MSILYLFVIPTIALVLVFILGYLMLRAITSLTELESLMLSGVAGTAILGQVAFFIFITGIIHWWVYVVSWISLTGCSIIIAQQRQRLLPRTRPPKVWLVMGSTLYFTLIASQSLLPIYTGSEWMGDWWMHYDIALFYLGQRPTDTIYFQLYTVVSRTPLFNLVEAFLMGVLGTDFYVYQLTAVVVSLTALPPFLLLVGHERMVLGLFIIVFNPFITTNLLYPWPKLLAAAYLLTSLYLYLAWRKKETIYSPIWTIFAGFALLTHPSTLFYIVAIIIDMIQQKKKKAVKPLLMLIGLIGIMMTPWIVWVITQFGYQSLLTSTPVTIRHQTEFTWFIWGVERFLNLVVSLVPHALIVAIYQNLMGTFPFNLFSFEGFNPVLFYYYHNLPGTLTTIMFLCCLLGFSRRQYDWAIPFFLCGFFGGILLQPGAVRHGLAPESMAPLILVGLMIATQFVKIFDISIQRSILGILLFEFTISRGGHTLFLGLGLYSSDDPNLLLKTEHSLLFARDLLMTSWPIMGLFVITGYMILVTLTLYQIQK